MNDIRKEVEQWLSKTKLPLFQTKTNDVLAYLIHLKYLCETGKYNYEDAIQYHGIYQLIPENYRLSFLVERENLPIHSLLRKIQNQDLKEVILEFLDSLVKPIEFHSDQDKILYIHFNRSMYSFYKMNGKATYVFEDSLEKNYDLFKIFDEVLGIKNQYISIKKVDKFSNYDYVYFYDCFPKYSLSKHNIYQEIDTYLQHNKNVVLYTSYNKISNFSDGRIISNFIKTIIIHHNGTVMLFNADIDKNQEISIIQYDQGKIKDLNQLYSILKKNRRQKDVLVKINYQELKENNLRIGFNLYQLEKNNEIRDINKIVDENTEYLEELNRINEKVEKEINVLLNR